MLAHSMEVISLCPLRVGSLLWQGLPGAWILTVVCKATYALAPTEAPLAAEQDEVNEDDTYWDDDSTRSLHSATDLVPFKLRADVIVAGHAFAPGERPVRSVIARLMVGEIDKSIEVFCDRSFTLDGRLREGAPFTRMSLAYERASGGPGTTNPVGVRRDVRDAYGAAPVPNLQPAGIAITSPGDSFDPIGFGPIAPIWPTRRERLGRHTERPSPRELLLGPLPEDIDRTFWNAAPLDQQVSGLRSNERLILENLHPKHPRLVTSLPGISPRAFIAGRAGGVLDLPMTADTLVIDTDRALCSMTWRGSFQLEHARERGRVVVGMEQIGKPLAWAEMERLLPRQDKSAPIVAPATRLSRPDIDIANAAEALQESTNTYVDGNEPSPQPGALPFGLQQGKPERSGPPAPPPPPPKRPPPPKIRETSDPFEYSTSVSNDKPNEADIRAAGLPFAPKPHPLERTDHPALSRSAGLPFVPAGSTPPPSAPAHAPPMAAPPMAAPPMAAPPMAAPHSTPIPAPPSSAPHSPAPPPLFIADSIARRDAPPPFRPPAPPPSAPATPRPDSRWASGAPPLPLPSKPAMPIGPAPQDSTQGLSASKDAPDAAVLVASNAAARAPWDIRRAPEAIDVDEEVVPDSEPESRPAVREVIELLWYDNEYLPRMRRNPPWRALLDELEERPADPDIEETSIFRSAAQAEDHRDVFEVLARGGATPGQSLQDALDKAVRDDGKFVPPLTLVAGDLVFPFDEAETLKAYIAAATPLAAGDEHLKSSIALAKEFLGAPGLAGAPGVAEGLISRMKEAFAMHKRPVPADYLDAQTSRSLLEKRCYQRRELFGGTYIRCLFHTSAVTGVSASALAASAGPGAPQMTSAASAPGVLAASNAAAAGSQGASGPVPTYLPDSLSKKLPLFSRFRMRMIGEIHLAVDQLETHPLALKATALSRAVERAARKEK